MNRPRSDREHLRRLMGRRSSSTLATRYRILRLLLAGSLLIGLAWLGWRLFNSVPRPPEAIALLAQPTASFTDTPVVRFPPPQATQTTTALSPVPVTEQRPGDPTFSIAAPTATPTAYFSFLPGVLQFQSERTPTPTVVFILPPPAPNWPDASPGLSNSKLGLHVIRANDSYIMEFVRRVHPRVMKSVDDVGWLAEVKAVSSATLTIGRLNEQNEDWALALDPAEAADLYIASQLERYRLNPGVDYWEGWNEYDPNDDAKIAWYGKFEAARVCKMRDLGLRAAVGGFAVGVPEYAEMGLFMPALEAAYECDGLFTLHEYNSPTMACGVAFGEVYAIPGAPHFSGVRVGYHALRYRFWYEGYLKPAGLGDLPLVISEAGIASGPPGGACNDPGSADSWKGYQDWWVNQGYGASGPEAHVNILAWYDNEMRNDAYVLGATIFTAGSVTGWETFEAHDSIIPLAWYAVNVPPLPTPPPGVGYP